MADSFTINMHITPDDVGTPAVVELTKERWATIVEGLCYAISNSDMDQNDRMEWSVILNGLVEQAGMKCPHHPEGS